MLELIFQGFIEWAYGLVLECWEYFSSVLLDIMSMDFAYLRQRMPVMDTIMEILLAVGWALLIGNLVFQAAKTMLSGIGFEGEDPRLLFTRTFAFSFLLLASPQICNLCLNLTSSIIELLELPDAVSITFADEASFGSLAAGWLLVVICGIIVMFQSFRLIFEMAERYLILAVLTITAPLAFGMGGSRNTSEIFSGWCRMYGSMCLLMVMHVVFIKLLLSILSFYPSGLDVLPWMILVLATVKVAKKIDGIITRLGLNPAITGDSLGRTFPGSLAYLVVRGAVSQVSKAVGKSIGGDGKGHGPETPPGGSGGGVPGGGSFSDATRGRRGGHQSTAQPNGLHSDTTQQNISASGDAAQKHSSGFASSSNASSPSVGPAGTRRTSVPTGAHTAVIRMRSGAGSSAVSEIPDREQPKSFGVQSGYKPFPPGERATPPAGTAGTGAKAPAGETRFSQAYTQGAQNGNSNHTLRPGACEQIHTSLSQASAAKGKPVQHARGDRFTGRDIPGSHGSTEYLRVSSGVSTGRTVSPLPDTAGMAGPTRETPAFRPARPGRNTASPTDPSAAPLRSAAGAASARPPGNGSGPGAYRGPAGTARDTARVPQGQNAVRRSEAPKRPSPAGGPLTSDTRPGPAISKGQSNQKQAGRPNRGGHNGRKK